MKSQFFLLGLIAVAVFAAPVPDYYEAEDCVEELLNAEDVEVSDMNIEAGQADLQQILLGNFNIQEESPAMVDEDCEEEVADTYEAIENFAAAMNSDANMILGSQENAVFEDEDCEEYEDEVVQSEQEPEYAGGDMFDYKIQVVNEQVAEIELPIVEEAEVEPVEECEE